MVTSQPVSTSAGIGLPLAVKANGFVFDKLHLVVAPRSDHTVTRKDDLLVKSALFDFLISTNRQL